MTGNTQLIQKQNKRLTNFLKNIFALIFIVSFCKNNNKNMSEISELKILRESEDRIEFKEAKKNYPLPEEVIVTQLNAGVVY